MKRNWIKEAESYADFLSLEEPTIKTTKQAKEYLKELRETNNSLLTTKQNEIMKILTVTNFIFLPLALIAGIFGMNSKSTPIINMPHDFYIILGIMGGLMVTMFSYFKWKKWL